MSIGHKGQIMVKAGVAGALLVGASLLGIFMMDPKLGGKTIDQTFADPQVAKLAKAACAGKTSKIAQLIADGVKVDAQGQDGMVAMFYALKCEQPAALEALLKAGANPNHAGKDGITGTYAAASYTDPIYLKLMLKYGGDPNLPLADGDTIFLQAFTTGQYSGKWDHFQLLLDYGVDVNLPRSKGGGGIADYAAAVGHPSKAVLLLERGYNYKLEELASAIYGNPMNAVSARYPNPLRNEPEYKYLAIAARMLKERGVDTEKVKREVDEFDKRVGAGLRHDY
ncbi:ankyrin repeat domain-containing protein, partial [Candidatus Phycosocius spiralis]|uniref:ankyrin repeat domain-containing protein n=1 Tax=Candidatus Phycosocius spiralis TaxID=2815099 RepID=UPI003B969A5D